MLRSLKLDWEMPLMCTDERDFGVNQKTPAYKCIKVKREGALLAEHDRSTQI